MAKSEFVSGLYRPDDDARLNRPRSITEILLDVRKFDEKRKRRKAYFQGKWPYSRLYESSYDPTVDRATYRMIGEKHPKDDTPIKLASPKKISIRLFSRIIGQIDDLRPSGVSLAARMEYVLSKVEPSLAPEEIHLYKQRLGKHYAERRRYRKAESEAAWDAWLKRA